MLGLGRFRRRKAQHRVAPRQPVARPVAPPPPAPPPVFAAVRATSRVRLIMADGTENPLPDDPELAARAEYLVNAILKPLPPD